MPENRVLPEGLLPPLLYTVTSVAKPHKVEYQRKGCECRKQRLLTLSAPPLYTLEMLRRAVSDDTVLEGTVQRCDGDLNLYLQLGSTSAKIPREEVIAPWISGADREIAVLSRVGKQVCFTAESLSADAKGAPTALLSRRKVQEQAMEEMRRGLKPGAGGGKGGTHGALRGLRGHWPGHRGSAAHGIHLRRPHPPSQRAVPGGAENSGSGQGL